MKNIFEVIRQKEQEIQELQKQIDALRIAARLLSDDSESGDVAPRQASGPVTMPTRVSSASAAGALKEFP